MRPDIGNWLLAGIDGLDEVGSVICTDLAAINLFDGTFRQWIVFEVFHRRPDDLAAVDKESTFGAFEENAVVTFAGDNHFHIVRHIDFDFEFVAALY